MSEPVLFRILRFLKNFLWLDRIPFFSSVALMSIPFAVTIQGSKMKPVGLRRYLVGVHEPGTTALCKRIIQKGDTVLDMGAELGYFSLLFSKLVGQGGRVLSFESDPYCLEKLRANIRRNHYMNVTVIDKAVSGNSGRTKFFVAKDKGTSSIFYPNELGGEWIDVECITVDDYLESQQITAVSFFKMDVEGAEDGVFKGMSRMVAAAKRDQRRLCGVVELSPRLLRAAGVSPETFLYNLQSDGFELFFIHVSGEVSAFPAKELIRRAVKERHINIFCDLQEK